MSIVIAILIFGLIVIIHEFGHFMMARKCGVLVEEFAIGMGPLLYSRKSGDTQYSLRLIPIGGYCKMLGEDGESGDPRAFNNKSLGRRTAILSFGAIMNLILAFVIFAFLTSVGGFTTTVISEVLPGTPAAEAGLMIGDRITGLNHTKTHIFEDLGLELTFSNGKPMEVSYVRNGQEYSVEITPYLLNENGVESYKLGFRVISKTGIFSERVEGFERASVWESLSVPVYQIAFWVRATVQSLFKLIIRQIPLNSLSGPIGIVSTINESYTQTVQQGGGVLDIFLNMLNLCAVLSANLGVFNLLPLPALDGGRLLFVLFEFIRRKPVPAEKEGMVHMVGFVLLMLLAVFIAYNDIMKLI